MSVNYRRCYEVLQLDAGASWEELRQQYKHLAQHCHPDRHQGDADALKAAEAALRELNTAYKILADYHKRHKRLPLGSASSRSDWQFQDTSKLREREEQLRVERRWSFLDLPVSRWMVIAFPGGVVLLVTMFLFSHSDNDGDVEAMDFSHELAPSSMRRKRAAHKEQPFFSYGDSWKKVVDVQGEPTAISGNTWFYGKSRIFFEDGHVVGWEHDKRNPLLVRGKVPGSDKDGDHLIHLGDIKKKVLKIQGKPLIMSERRWEYGPSFVEFRDGKVVRWHSSVLRPLAVAQPDARKD